MVLSTLRRIGHSAGCEWTLAGPAVKNPGMKVMAYILVLALLAAFGTVGVANVSASTSMEMQMLTATGDHSGMIECIGCDTQGPAMMSCGEMCFASHTMTLAESELETPSMHRIAFVQATDVSTGMQTPPEPFPPKAHS
ncbi:MAG: hypothetical protein P1U65_08305 [Minwuia sp.]|nr:hypothetical protein [Minwuia sp.]